MKFVTVEQVRLLADAAEVAQVGAGTMVTFAAWTGLRWSEIVALRRSSLDLLRRQVHVWAAVTEVSRKLISGRPKNHQVRTIVMPGGSPNSSPPIWYLMSRRTSSSPLPVAVT